MKFAVKIVLLMFLIFLSTPTIIGLLSDDTDSCMVYSTCEEESHKDIKVEVKALISESSFIIVQKKIAIIFFNYLLKHDNVSKDILSPPPDII